MLKAEEDFLAAAALNRRRKKPTVVARFHGQAVLQRRVPV
jgi:hypothetical protein